MRFHPKKVNQLVEFALFITNNADRFDEQQRSKISDRIVEVLEENFQGKIAPSTRECKGFLRDMRRKGVLQSQVINEAVDSEVEELKYQNSLPTSVLIVDFAILFGIVFGIISILILLVYLVN